MIKILGCESVKDINYLPKNGKHGFVYQLLSGEIYLCYNNNYYSMNMNDLNFSLLIIEELIKKNELKED